MKQTNFSEVFETASGFPPYAYQCRLACGPTADSNDPSTLRDGTDCRSHLIEIPTGLGKTAAVVLAWLWNRVYHRSEQWPRRLVYCLPMRTLVEQTRDNVTGWLDKLDLPERPSVEILMGGEETDDWDIHPERDAILIGTQDMLLSRALNRGYGLSRARWPMHFGLLNNDCLWVLDETQLMGVGVRTSAQLAGLRAKIGTCIDCATWWASATLDSRLLATPDYRSEPDALALTEKDLRDSEIQRRVAAVKRLASLPITLDADSGKAVQPYLAQLADTVLDFHRADTTTIVILNRVDRAQQLFSAIEKLGKKRPLPQRILVHSRFRPMERDALSKKIGKPGDRILVATQAIEAGVDITARTLITELAPWSSLVQRFGRCNRKGEFNDGGGADIHWINLEAADDKAAVGLALPYAPEQLATARELLREVEPVGAAPEALGSIPFEEPLPEAHILRRKDIVDLFDTTPDLAGLDIDVGRYIRDGEERDVQVFWRELPAGTPPQGEIVPQRRELVRVPLNAFRKFARGEKSNSGIWSWSVLDGEWQPLRAERIAPGQVYLLEAALGGYSVSLGWTGQKSREPFPLLTCDEQPRRSAPRDGQSLDDESHVVRDEWQSVETHTAHVLDACEEKLKALSAAGPWADALRTAVRWHDVGKTHACFQTFIVSDRSVPDELRTSFIAKSPRKSGSRHARPHFRHELASALAWLQAGRAEDPTFKDLVAYLVATHHGKIRLSLRAMPGELAPESSPGNGAPLFARGIWHGDKLPSNEGKSLAIEGVPAETFELDLSCMQMGERNGQPSWTARMIGIRDSADLGLFRLAWLEAILRAADAEGSRL